MRSTDVAENNAAWSAAKAPRRTGLRETSGTSDSKHSDAAALAVDLASNSSWSEAFSPSGSSTQDSMNEELVNAQELDHPHHHTVREHLDLGPPPEYSPSQQHVLTPDVSDSDSGTMQYPSPRREMAASSHSADDDAEPNHRQDVGAPLLGVASNKSPDETHPWKRDKGAPSFRYHRLWWLNATLGLMVILLAGGLIGKMIVCSSWIL